MFDWSSCPAVERSPKKVSGAWVFRGTRIPVSALFENLEGGARVDELVEWFPGVTKEQVEAVLEHANRSLALSFDGPCGRIGSPTGTSTIAWKGALR